MAQTNAGGPLDLHNVPGSGATAPQALEARAIQVCVPRVDDAPVAFVDSGSLDGPVLFMTGGDDMVAWRSVSSQPMVNRISALRLEEAAKTPFTSRERLSAFQNLLQVGQISPDYPGALTGSVIVVGGTIAYETPREVNSWPKPCEAMFRYLARNRPRDLASHLRESSYTPGLRARAAEAAGDIEDHELARSFLLPLLRDAAPIVREAAIYGLERHQNTEVRERLRGLVSDPHTTDGVRAAASEALDED